MATPQALTAFIRASRPDFKSTADKAAFAVHAILSVNGFSMRKAGEGVDEAVAQGAAWLPPPEEEVELTGWNWESREGDGGTTTTCYSFLYVPESSPDAKLPHKPQQQQQQAASPLLLVKCLRLATEPPLPSEAPGVAGSGGGGGGGDAGPPQSGGLLLVSLADVSSPSRPPVSLEIPVDKYVSSMAPGAIGYERLEEMIQRVQEALGEVLEGPEAKAKAAGGGRAGATTTATANTAAASTGEASDKTTVRDGGDKSAAAAGGAAQPRSSKLEGGEERRWRDPLGRGERYPGPGMPTHGSPGLGPMMGAGIGDEDMMPGGLPRPPGLGGGGGIFGGGALGPGGPLGGAVPLGPRGGGGGMHVGPENPIFVDRLRHPRGVPGLPPGVGGGGSSAVLGMRWDPIAPEGLQGWSPDDYVRGGRMQRGEDFNDIGRPPPGRGPDWDHMFG